MDPSSLSYLHYDYRSQRPSPRLEYPPPLPHYSGHEAKFDVQVRVQRSFSFEELQSGSYFASLDESDLQFYRVYGQPVLIPSPDEVDANFMVHGAYPTADFSCESNGLHLDHPPVLTTKSYTLQNPLGDGLTGRHSRHSVAHSAHDWQPVKQEPIEVRHTMQRVPLYLISSRAS
ncbi:hypothetical protein OG21DRAFT_1469607 [Imleria badia]|nr:hypothetical protein OG21DRAFT_1469607 [Imleria badia]